MNSTLHSPAKIFCGFLTSAFFLLSSWSTAQASLYEYSAPVLLARTNIGDGYNLPAMGVLSRSSPVINEQGDVAFKWMSGQTGEEGSEEEEPVDGVQSLQGLWFMGKVAYTAPSNRSLSNPSLNDKGQVLFGLYGEGVTEGLYVLDADTLNTHQVVVPGHDGVVFYTYPQLLNDGKIYFRGTNQKDLRSFYKYGPSLSALAREGTYLHGHKSSYLFKPSLNEEGSLAFRRRIGREGEWNEEQDDEILLLKPKEESFETVVIARDRDADSASPYLGFLSSPSLSNNRSVAFMAMLEDKRKVLALYSEGHIAHLALEKEGGLLEFEMTSPVVNGRNEVLFIAKNEEGKRGLYLARGKEIERLIGEGDPVDTDLGKGKILLNPNYPGLGGEVDMNDRGEIVFSCLVVDEKSDKEWGTAVFKLSPQHSF